MVRRTTLVTPGKRSRGNKPFRRVGIFMLIVLMLAASAVAGLSYLGSSINNGGNNIGGEAGFSLGDDEELVDDVRVTLKDQEMEALCGTRKNANLPESTFVHMAQIREFLAGQAVGGEAFNDAVSLPVVMRQSTVNAQRAVAPTQDELFKALAVILNDEMAKIAELPLADQGAAVIALLDDKLMEPKFADMVNQALLTFPAFAEQNDWSVEFDAQVKEAMSREEDGELAIGFWAFVHFANAEAKAANDFSQLRMNTDENLGKGDFNFWRTYCHLCATMRQLFTFEGAQALESVDNWKLPEVADWANTRIIRADQQEDRPAYIFVHRDKMGRITFKMGFNLADSRVELFEKKATQIPESPKVTPEDPADPPANPPAEVDPPAEIDPPVDPPVEEPKDYLLSLRCVDDTTGDVLLVREQGRHQEGYRYDITAPMIPDYAALTERVAGTMPAKDLVVEIRYKKNDPTPPEEKLYNAVVQHVILDKDGNTAADQSKAPAKATKIGLKDGAIWEYTAPVVSGYTASPAVATLTISGADASATIFYRPNKDDEKPTECRVIVNYIIADGGIANPPSKSEVHRQGEGYSIPSYVINGYIPDREVVEGVMPDHDVVETVTYRRQDGNGNKNPADSSDQKEENDQGTGDREDGTDDGSGQNGNDGDIETTDKTDTTQDSEGDDSNSGDPDRAPVVDGADNAPAVDGVTGDQSDASDSDNGVSDLDELVIMQQPVDQQPVDQQPVDQQPVDNNQLEAAGDGEFQENAA